MGMKDGDSMPTTQHTQDQKLIDIEASISTDFSRRLCKPILTAVECILAIDKINAIHQSIPRGMDAKRFCRASLNALDVDYAVTEHELSHVPEQGPLVMVANILSTGHVYRYLGALTTIDLADEDFTVPALWQEVEILAEGDLVKVAEGHTAGGDVGRIYKYRGYADFLTFRALPLGSGQIFKEQLQWPRPPRSR